MKLNLLQLEALKNSGGAGLTFQSPQDFLTWQAAARAGQLSAMGIPQSNEAAFQMQLLAQQQMAAAAMAQQQHQQQQQQQQQNEAAMANFQQALAASQGMPAVIPFMQPFPLATPTGKDRRYVHLLIFNIQLSFCMLKNSSLSVKFFYYAVF